MTQMNFRAVAIAVLVIAVAAISGCQEQSEATRGAAKSEYVNPTPEESFELIVETFRRGIEDVPIGFVLRDGEGHSMMTGRNEVSHTLIPPAKEGEPYKAIITVGSQSRYSIQRSADEEVEEEETSDESKDSFADEGKDPLSFDDDVIGSGEKSKSRRTVQPTAETNEKTVTRKVDRQRRDYELVYQDGKWKLVTKLDPETEQSIQNAFKRALEMQI